MEKEPSPALPQESREVPEVHWTAPDFGHELGEIFRTAERFVEDPDDRTGLALRMYEALSKAGPEDLTDDLWQRLENTDSYDIRQGDFDAVRTLAEANSRDFDFHLQRMLSGEPVPAPTIAIVDGVAHKVGGNTRLMIARVLGVRPKVVIARIDTHEALPDMPELDMEGFGYLVSFYERNVRQYANREALEEALAAYSEGALSDETIQKARRLADIYYASEPPPTLEEFIRKAKKDGIV
jgi:hypothetical protein